MEELQERLRRYDEAPPIPGWPFDQWKVEREKKRAEEKAAQEKAAQEKAAQEKAAQERAAQEKANKKKTIVLRPDDSWLAKTDPPPPPIPAKSPLRNLLAGVPSTIDSKRFSPTEGYFESSVAEEQTHRDLTPPALRIIRRREEIEARFSNDSISRTPPGYYRSPSRAPDYYEDTNVVPRKRTLPGDRPQIPGYYEDTNIVSRNRQPLPPEQSEPKLSQLIIHKILSAQSLSEIPTPDDPEEAKSLEQAWTIKQRKISFNQLENLPADHGLTELFARFRIPSEES